MKRKDLMTETLVGRILLLAMIMGIVCLPVAVNADLKKMKASRTYTYGVTK